MIAKEFVAMAIQDMIQQGVGINMPQTLRVKVDEGTECNGFFDDDPVPSLNVAMGKPESEWFPTFVHEYCHFRQWIEREPTYFAMQAIDAEGELDLWLEHKVELPEDRVQMICKLTQDNEINCEKRVLQMIKKHNMHETINPIEYAKKANAYMYFYTRLPHIRQWYGKKAPYEVQEVIRIMPGVLQEDYSQTPARYNELIDNNCL